MTNYNVSFKRMEPDDYVEITGKMPHDSFVRDESTRQYYEEIIKKHPLNKPQNDTFTSESTKKSSTEKSLWETMKNFFEI